MLYTQDLENIVFGRHEVFESDELVIISGYLGPSPVSNLQSLPLKCKVIYGMYPTDGIQNNLHHALLKIQNVDNNVNIYYSKIPVHSKCYIWKNHGRIVHALIGSANFSTNGLTTPFREVLAETTRDTFDPLNIYSDLVMNNSISCLELGDDVLKEPIVNKGRICDMSLLDLRTGEVQKAAGLNWGQSIKAHVNPNDAYIPIRTKYIKEHPLLYPPKQVSLKIDDNRGRAVHRHNDAVEVLWDDGVTMECLFEGSQPVNGEKYPKQISSFPVKAEMGEYLRTRLGVPSGQPVRKHHLDSYGRTDISVTLIGEGIYKFDFSV